MSKWKVGVVGLQRGRVFIDVFNAHPKTEVVAICDINEELLESVGKSLNLGDGQKFISFDDFLTKSPLDIVVIATPIEFHTEQTIKSLEAGKDVLCEQTVAYTVSDCERIVEAVKKTGRVYMMAENYIYFHYLREWKNIIDSGKLGKIVYAENEYLNPIVPLLVDEKTGKFSWRATRAPIWYCAHSIGPLLHLTGDRIVKAMGILSDFQSFPQYKEYIGFVDAEIAIFQTQKGTIIKVITSNVSPRGHLIYYSLYGTNGYLESPRKGEEGLMFIKGEMNAPIPFPCKTVDREGIEGLPEFYMIEDFLKAVESRSRPPIDVIRAMDFTVPGLIAHESALSGGKWLDVPLFEW
ncbi:Gfo/Idh/MocA family oxidoreductase [bacterium]|nr:Gfo/Idh/MocA family oxidoreductase [bacterium]